MPNEETDTEVEESASVPATHLEGGEGQAERRGQREGPSEDAALSLDTTNTDRLQ